jgi:hypothetical protein
MRDRPRVSGSIYNLLGGVDSPRMKYLTFDQQLRLTRRAAHNRLRQVIRLRRKRLKFLRRAADLDLAMRAQAAFVAKHQVAMPSRPDRIPLMVPEVFSLRDNHEETVGIVRRMRDTVLSENRPVQLYFDQLRKLEPAAALLLVAEIFRCRQLRPFRAGHSVTGNYPQEKEIFFQLREMGFFRALSVDSYEKQIPDERPRGERPHFIGFQTMSSVHPELAATFCDVVTSGAFEMTPLSRGKMIASLKEAMLNAHEHAYRLQGDYDVMRRRWWLAGHVNPVHREMMVMILDQGVGIPRTLEPTAFEQVKALLKMSWTVSDGTMIAAATQIRRTSTGQGGRGRGFEDMKRFIDSCDDGELRVCSNRGQFIYTKTKQEMADYPASIGGTLIEWRVRHQGSAVEINDE